MINSEQDYYKALARVEALMLCSREEDAAELDALVLAIQQYEDERFPIPAVRPEMEAIFRSDQEDRVQLLAAVSTNWAIGKDGSLPWHISEDLEWFKAATMGKSIIMGRKTWDSIGGKPLKGRHNIVLTSRKIDGVDCATSIEEAMAFVESGPIVIMGGAEVYRQAAAYVDVLFISEVDVHVSTPFVMFPFDLEEWDRVVVKAFDQFTLVKYTRKTY